MIRFQMMSRAAIVVLGVAGCASSASRMPPTGPVMPTMAPVAPMPAPMPMPVVPAYSGPVPMAPQPIAMTPLPATQPAPAPARGIAGLTERQPDLCGASRQSTAIGQPGGVIQTLGLTKPFRVVEYRGIEPQDYDPNRIVFRLDAAGTITSIDCG